ncbi:MAG: Gfo/Idh/MocA family oxidoreductase [Bacteroidota bacterium]|nr:Gfo/Idh/MocA family oxidoreductase [Bacteroidota bacterium]MDP4191838.1 Gfo/Idh/MocA family oxidoreductase [Bacteroidota bacterium]MDP4195272.1 Gfo/Idh/MocA family oxidoreductase [Bacteroidota bacterium]
MLKGAVIGFGKIARTGHMPAYLSERISKKIKITSICDPDETLKETISKEYPGIRFYKDPDEMFNKEIIDFVDICSPPLFHKHVIEKAIVNKKHILCEKPLSHNLSDSQKISQSIKESKIKFSICHQYKYSPIWKEFKEFVENGNNESGIFIQFNVYRTNADNGFFKNNPSWRTNKKISGGGILSDTGVHYIYLSNWLMGKPLSVTACNTELGSNNLEVEDTSLIILEYERGIVQINLTWAADRRENLAKASSRNGSLVYMNNTLTSFQGEIRKTIEVPDASDKKTYISLYENLLDEFIGKIKDQDKANNSIDEALETIYVLDACYRAAKEKRTVVLC